jgi:hypothetical protein
VVAEIHRPIFALHHQKFFGVRAYELTDARRKIGQPSLVA